MTNSGLAIQVDKLSKTYRNGITALSGVTFSVKMGEIFGLLGPNGAGKSTAVRILATLTSMSKGTAIVVGNDVLSNPQVVRENIGYVAQSTGVDRWATGRENLVLQAQLERVPRSRIVERVEYLLHWIGLENAANNLVNSYSGGMRRRLEIVMGLVH